MNFSSACAEYVLGLPPARQEPFDNLLEVIQKNIDPRFEGRIIYGMPGWVVPFEIYEPGYHCDPSLPVPFINLGNKKGHISLYHMGLYAFDSELKWFEKAYQDTGYKLNMGKSCVRFTSMTKIPYQLIGELAARIDLDTYMKIYKTNLS